MKSSKHLLETKWMLRFLNLAENISQWSKDPSTKVGSVIVKNRRIIGTGYNGFPSNIEDSEVTLYDKDRKRLRTVHAEMNALNFATKSIKNSTIFCTHPTCAACMANLLQHKPAYVVTWEDNPNSLSKDWDDSIKEAEHMASEAGVRIIKFRKG